MFLTVLEPQNQPVPSGFIWYPSLWSHLSLCFQLQGQREAQERRRSDGVRRGGALRLQQHGVSAGCSDWTGLTGQTGQTQTEPGRVLTENDTNGFVLTAQKDFNVDVVFVE